MLQELQEIKEEKGFLFLSLKKKENFDSYIYDQIRMDEECLQPTQLNEYYRFDIQGLLSLESFLDHYVFQRQEGYRFLIMLFEHILKVNRNKPLLFDVRYIYLPAEGNFLRFVCVPLNIEHWHLQKDISRRFVEYLAHHFQTKEAYEIIGFMIRSVLGDEFSLTSVLRGLFLLEGLYRPKQHFWERLSQKKGQQCFEARAEELSRLHEREKKTLKESSIMSEDQKWNREKTMLLGEEPIKKPYLEGKKNCYKLKGQIMIIGRDADCEIRLESALLSKKHLQLTCRQDRWYARDLKSKNGSWLNGKRMQREMRLKEGMVLKTADCQFIFHEGQMQDD